MTTTAYLEAEEALPGTPPPVEEWLPADSDRSKTDYQWALGGRITAQIIQLLGFLALGHLVAPSQFGVYAAVSVFIALGQIFTDLGIGPAVVQQANPTQSFLSTAFWVNLITGVVLTSLSAAIAFPLASWFGYEQLKWAIPLASLVFTVSLSTVGLALLERRFRFRVIAFAEISAAALALVVSTCTALVVPSVLALIMGPLVSATTLSIIVIAATKWRPLSPRRSFRRQDIADLRDFVSFLSLFNLITFGMRNGDNFFLGAHVSAQQLGFYARSYQLMLLPVFQITLALGRVLRPTFARARESRDMLQREYTQAMKKATTIGFLSAAVMVSMAPYALPVLLGEQWRPMVPIFQILGLSIPFQAMTTVHGPLYTATAKVKLLLATGATTSSLLLAAFIVFSPYGTIVVAWVFTAHSVLSAPMTAAPILRSLRLTALPCVRVGLLAAVAGACLYGALAGTALLHPFGRGAIADFLGQLVVLVGLVLVAAMVWRRRTALRAGGPRRAESLSAG